MPSATFTLFKSWLDYEAEAANMSSDSFVVALINTAPTPASDSVLADITEVSYANLSSRALTVSSSGLDGSTYEWVVADITLTSSGGATGPFRYAVIYDNTLAGDPLVGSLDYGSSITLQDGDALVLDFSAATGLIQKTASP